LKSFGQRVVSERTGGGAETISRSFATGGIRTDGRCRSYGAGNLFVAGSYKYAAPTVLEKVGGWSSECGDCVLLMIEAEICRPSGTSARGGLVPSTEVLGYFRVVPAGRRSLPVIRAGRLASGRLWAFRKAPEGWRTPRRWRA